jgi:hypothetical protein
MVKLIEIKILSYQILLPLRSEDTVASISEAALQEYYKLNLKKPPQKVLYTCDSKGRVLSGNLPLPLPGSNSNPEGTHEILEVKIEDYSNKDLIPVEQLEKLYRDWQFYLLTQLKEYFQYLTYRENPVLPEKRILLLLKEISKVSNESIQLFCISLYKLLLMKFTQLEIIHYAVEELCRLFLSTNNYNIAIAVLTIFQDLSPLQMKLFNSVKYMRLMLDVENHLIRFFSSSFTTTLSSTGQKNKIEIDEREMKRRQSELFALFEKILSLLNDNELNTIFQKNKQEYDQYVFSQNTNNFPRIEEKDNLLENKLYHFHENFDEEVAIYQHKFQIPNKPNPESGDTSKTGDDDSDNIAAQKKWNLSRLQSLILSDDWKIRTFSLENLKKMLKASHDSVDSSEAKKPEDSKKLLLPLIPETGLEKETPEQIEELLPTPPNSASTNGRLPLGSFSSEVNVNKVKSAEKRKKSLDQPLSNNNNTPVNDNNSLNAKVIRFVDEDQYKTLIKILMQCLQKSIKGRNQDKLARNKSANQNTNTSSPLEQLNQLSTAGRLSYIALKSPETDLTSVQLIFECLSLLFTFPSQLFPVPKSQKRPFFSPYNPLIDNYLTEEQGMFIEMIKEYYRLLFTLSHCYEYYLIFPDYYHLHPHHDLFLSLSERSAFFFNLILFYSFSLLKERNAGTQVAEMFSGKSLPTTATTTSAEQGGGWKYCQLPMEKLTIKYYLLTEKPNYRLFMALTYLIYLIKKHLIISRENPKAAKKSTDKDPQAELQGIDFLNDFFAFDNFNFLHSLWSWCIAKKSNLFIRRLAFQILSKIVVMNEIAYQLWRLDPIPR